MRVSLEITSKDEPSFAKPIDLAFPLPDFTKVPEAQRPPADKPEDAYFYVVRRLEGPCEDGSDTCAAAERKVLFQTIDHAFAECPEGKPTCEASEKKVVTASYPFSGYVDSFGGFSFLGSGLLIQPVAAAYGYLMWSYDQLLPGQALAGVVTGKVLRTKWNPGATVPQYEAVEGALVTAVDASGERLMTGEEHAAISGKDGTFTLWDSRYVGGTVRVAATLPGVGGDVTDLCPPGEGGDATFRCATAYEADPLNFKSSGLRFHKNIATVNLTFPPTAPPPPPPAIGVTVYRTVDGKRADTRGIVTSGTPLILGVKPSSGAVEVREVLVQGGSQSFRSDPLKGQPTGSDWIAEYTPANVGTYRVEVTGLSVSESGTAEAVKGGTTFRVIGAGGRSEVVEGVRPEVIPAQTVPKTGASGVQISTFLQVVFTEPVRKIPGNVVLKDAKGQPVAVKLSGTLPEPPGGVVVDLNTAPDAAVTSLTVQPLSGLEYGATYRLELGDGIVDLDTKPCGPEPAQPPPCKLEPYETSFTTFTPESLSQNPESFGSPGIVVLEDRAYLVQNHFHSGTLRVFDTTDPVNPQEIPNGDADPRDPRYMVVHRPVDLVGEAQSPLTGGRVVAVLTGPTARSNPSNLWLFDVKDDARTEWIGAASLTTRAMDGGVFRTFMRAGVLYAATYRKGIQVVDLGKVMDAFKAPGTPEHYTMWFDFIKDGVGYGSENVTSIPVNSPFGDPAHFTDIEAALMETTAGGEVLVATTSDAGLTVVNPATQSVLWNDKLTYEREEGGQKVVEATLRYGQALALGNVSGQDIAVVVGTGTILQETQSRPLLMVVSLFDPQNPVGLGYVPLEEAWTRDVILKDDLALLGGSKQVTLVSLTDKARPKVLGTAQGVGGRLALGENGSILFSTMPSVFGGTNIPLGGVRTAALGSIALIKNVSPMIVPVDDEGRSTSPITVTYRFIAPPEDLSNGWVSLARDDQQLALQPVPSLRDGTFVVTIPSGLPFNPPDERVTIRVTGTNSATSGPVTKVINEPGQSEGDNFALLLEPVFEGVTPGVAARAGHDLSISVRGQNLAGLARVFVRGPSGEWTGLDTKTRTATKVTFVLLGSMLGQEGVLQIAPHPDEERSLAFIVSDPDLPQPGTAQGVTVASVTPDELGAGATTLTISGTGFAEGVQAVLGRGTGGILLPTTVTDDAEIFAELPAGYLGKAADIFVAVRSADGATMTSPVAVRSTMPQAPINYANILAPDDIAITGTRGALVWNGEDQTLQLDGIGLSVGSQVFFSAGGQAGQSATVTAKAPSTPPPSPAVPSVPPQSTIEIKVPKNVTKLPDYCLILQTDDQKKLAASAPWCLGARPAAKLPLGGRMKFVGYAGASDADRIYVVPEPDPEQGSLTCKAQSGGTPKTFSKTIKAGNKTLIQVDPLKIRFYFDVSKTLRSNPYDAPGFKSLAQVPLVEREYNRCDPDNPNVLYLRGVRQSVGDEKMTVTAEFTDPDSGKIRRGEVPVTVVRGSLGGTTPGGAVIEDAILDAAARTGVPPQFMKAQVYFETSFDPTKYRYEPMTIDFVNVSGDVPDGSGVLSRNNTTYGPYIRKHLYQGSAVLEPNLTDPSRSCAVLLGLNASPPPEDVAGCIVHDGRTAHTTELPIRGVETRVVGRQGLPGQPGYQLADVKASRLTYLPPGQQGPPAFVKLEFIEAPRWSINGGNVVQVPTRDQFWFDYSSNKVQLGRQLTEGEWVRITYHVVPEEQVGTGATCNALVPASLNGKAKNPNMTFQAGDSIASWFLRNTNDPLVGGNPVFTGTEMEKSVEFRLDMGQRPGKRRVGLLDSRFRAASAQFSAAGSFGLTHFTIKPWLNANLAAVLNKAFDLNARCLYNLADGPTREKDALAATAAYHSFNYQRPSCTQCDQVDWAQNWAKIINKYNSRDDKYQVKGGLSEITKRGITVYDAR